MHEQMSRSKCWTALSFMSLHPTLVKQLPLLAVLALLTGCAVWTGGIPASYADKGKYPIVACVHGIREVTFSDDLHKIVTSYTPTNEITLNTNTIHGWLIQIQPAEKPVEVREYFVLPKAARLGSKSRTVSLDQTTSLTDYTAPKGVKYISEEWGMYADDPLGQYEIAVFLDGKLAADFKFSVIEQPKATPISKDRGK